VSLSSRSLGLPSVITLKALRQADGNIQKPRCNRATQVPPTHYPDRVSRRAGPSLLRVHTGIESHLLAIWNRSSSASKGRRNYLFSRVSQGNLRASGPHSQQ
jgi:hypothetical protein